MTAETSPPSPSRAAVAFVLSTLAILYGVIVVTPLTSLPLFQWDESRLAVNALEMVDDGRWLVTHFGGAPDMWNTKPPLMIWAMALSLELFGLNSVAARIPAVVAGGLTVLLVAWFTTRLLANAWTGFLAGVVLMTSVGFVGVHAATTADYDALLTLCMTVTAGAWLLYVESGRRAQVAVALAAFACGVLTKSTAALLLLPALLVYTVVRRRLWTVLRDRSFLLASAGAVVTVAAYYLARERLNPGYIEAVVHNEITGRYFAVNENHSEGKSFYVRNFWAAWREWRTATQDNGRLVPWLPLVALGTTLSFFGRDEARRRLALFCSLWAGLFLFVVSTSRTKLFWYDVPLYPAAAVLAALACEELVRRAACVWRPVPAFVRVAIAAALLAPVVWLTVHRLARTPPEERGHPEYVAQLRRERPELEHLAVPSGTHSAALRFYVQAASMTARAGKPRPTGSPVFVVCDAAQFADLETRNDLDIVHRGASVCGALRMVPKAPAARAE